MQDFIPQYTKEPLQAQTEAQAHLIMAIERSTIVFVTGPAGTGKAQPLDAKIRTPYGWRRMGEMQIGSEILAPNGERSNVVAIHPQGKKKIFKITFADGRSTECCEDHLWRVYRYDWQPDNTRWRTVSTKELIGLLKKPSCKNRLYVQLPDGELKADVDLPIDPYVMGVLLGDGGLTVSVGVSCGDRFVIDQVSDLIPDSCKLKYRGNVAYSIIGKQTGKGENKVLTEVKKLGLFGKKSTEKFIPEIYQNSSSNQKIQLLQGMLDTDGYVCKSGSIQLSTSSETMAKQTQELIRSIGGICSINIKDSPKYSHKGETKIGKTNYTLNIRYKSPRDLMRLPRKRSRLPVDYQYADSLRLRIESVEEVGMKKAQCITVSNDDHLYITDDYIVTHNSYVSTMMALDTLQNGDTKQLILTRPAMEAGEKLGFLPGDKDEKYEPYLAPFRGVINRYYGNNGSADALIKSRKIVPYPLAYMRGETFDNAWLLLDEAQNVTREQILMAMTRLGKYSKMIINGDPQQTDGPDCGGLLDAIKRLKNIDEVSHIEFTEDDIVRSDIVGKIIRAYRD